MADDSIERARPDPATPEMRERDEAMKNPRGLGNLLRFGGLPAGAQPGPGGAPPGHRHGLG